MSTKESCLNPLVDERRHFDCSVLLCSFAMPNVGASLCLWGPLGGYRTTSTLFSGYNPALLQRVGRVSRLPGCLCQINVNRPMKYHLEQALVEGGRDTEAVAELH